MKKLSVLMLIVALCLVGWALPASAEKIRLTDAELDGITAGFPLVLEVPPVGSPVWNCCAQVTLSANGSLMPLLGSVGLSLQTIPINPTIRSVVSLNASGAVPGIFSAGGSVFGPKGLVVPLPIFVLPIP